ncbi:MAG: hypothetical protein KY476_13940 [Planctomycetes bacterium]|nr:hypothetical protein [Planctomycetota bacterium]
MLMSSRLRSLFAGVLALAACLFLLLNGGPTGAKPAGAVTLEAEGKLQWYRGNLHTHSLWSDGDDYPEMIALWYKERGYDFLCFTDHNILSDHEKWTDVEKNKGGRVAYDKLKERFPDGWVDERGEGEKLQVRLKKFAETAERLSEPGEFLLIQGEEISDRFEKFPIHLNATNLDEVIPPMKGESVYETIQNNVNAAVARRERTGRPLLIHLNHPNFGWGVTAEDLMRVRGENFFEVYNGHPGVRNSGDEAHASTERIWDIILTQRIAEFDLPLMYGLATDDGHSYHRIPSRASEPGRGWVMVLAETLTPEALIEAMEDGRFYASSGVELESVVSSTEGLDLRVKAEPGVSYKIEFLGTREGYDPTSEPVKDAEGNAIRATRRYSDDIGSGLKTVEGPAGEYRFSGDELYVRARVMSTKQQPNPSEPGEFERAWAQPVRGPAGRH